MQTFTRVSPPERVGKQKVPRFDELHDRLGEHRDRREGLVLQAFLVEYAKPYLDHVQPRPMEGYEVHDDALVLGLKPSASLLTGVQRLIGYAAEIRYRCAEILMEVSAEIVHDVVKLGIGGKQGYVFAEDFNESRGVVRWYASSVHLAVFHLQKRQ